MKTIRISDVSLRTIYGEGNSALSFKEKLEIVKNLNDLNVDFVEFPRALGNKTEETLVKTSCALAGKSGIALVCGNTEEEIEKSYALISSAKKKKLIVSVPVSPVQMEYHAAKKPKAVLELLGALTKKASSLCDKVDVELSDATRAEHEFLINAIKIAIESGASEITLSDEHGISLASDIISVLEDLFVSVPELKNVGLNLRCSDAFSLGVSNVISGILGGVNGIKLAAGGAIDLSDFEKTIISVEEIGSKKGFCTSINKTALGRITGRIKGIVSNKERTIDVATESEEIIPENVSLSALSKIVKKRGYALDNDELSIVLSEIKRLSEKKTVNYKELDVIVATSVLQVPPTYKLVSFSIQSSNVLPSTASVCLKKADKELSGLSFGNGSVDAAFLALEEAIGRHFELDGFELGAVTEGKEAMGQAIVSLRSEDKIYSGRGVSTDIVGASIRAYINALNKIVYEENNL